jgi:hypothetical protein
VGFERTISAGERPQTYENVLDRAATAGKETLHCLQNQYQNLIGMNLMLTGIKSALDIFNIKNCDLAYSKHSLHYE